MSVLTPDDRSVISRALSHYSGIVAGSRTLSDQEVVEEMCAIRTAQNNLDQDQWEATHGTDHAQDVRRA